MSSNLIQITTGVFTSILHAKSSSAVKKARALAIDVYLVAIGIRYGLPSSQTHRFQPRCRTGCLLDTFSPPNPVLELSRAVEALRKVGPIFPVWELLLMKCQACQASRIYAGVVHIYDPGTAQSFFVNASLVQQTLTDSDKPWTSFVSLTDPPTLVTPPFTLLSASLTSR
jgi:hypothetical protein